LSRGPLLLLLLCAGPAFPAPTPHEEAAGDIVHLRTGEWNERVHATHELGELGDPGLPGLRLAAEDADWQVRMTAVHLMGRLGEAAVPDLAEILRTEPCRHVRLTALHWLGAIGGPRASEALRAGLGDESGMVRLMGRYWLDKTAGKSEAGFNPDTSAAVSEDLKSCETSPEPRRAPWADARRKPAAPAPDDGSDEIVVTPDPVVKAAKSPRAAEVRAPETLPEAASAPSRPATATEGAPQSRPLSRQRLKELDALLSPDENSPENLPGAGSLLPRAKSPAAEVAALAPDQRSGPNAAVAAPRARSAAESFPAAPPGLPERVSKTSGAEIVPDAGTGKAETDPLPPLLKLLADADPAKRARAADELGKRGARAASAAPALTVALKDEDKRVRASAALALGNLGAAADAAVPALVAALKRGPEEVGWSAAVALGRIGTPRARKAFARYARQSAGDLVRGAPAAPDR
jgi:hypothetical protein